eukprot:c348_g1_i1.p1 GENE.c348_g1_i1~~c348_g1_i1.p1  ORF type:complete len:359 (-),score=59.70 c348_g1_i1:332-1321(-)
MTSISNLLNKDSPPPSPTHQPFPMTPTCSTSPSLSLKETPTQSLSLPSSPTNVDPRFIRSAPLKQKRKSDNQPNATLSDSVRHRIYERVDIFDSDEDSIGDDALNKSRKVSGSLSPRSSPRSIQLASAVQNLVSEDDTTTSPVLLPRFTQMNIRHTSPSPLSHEFRPTRSYQSPVITASSNRPYSPLTSSSSSAPGRSQVPPYRVYPALAQAQPIDSSHKISSFVSPTTIFDDSTATEPTARPQIEETLVRDLPTLKAQFEVVMAENNRLRDFNCSLLTKIERSYEQLLQSQHRPEQLTQQRDTLREFLTQKQNQIKRLREEWSRLALS